MSAKSSIASVASEIFDLLDPLPMEERQRAVAGALTLLGMTVAPAAQGAQSPSGGSNLSMAGGQANAQAFFASKDPGNKIEELAVAARFRELSANEHQHSKVEFQKVFKEARRNFDVTHFARDMENAKTRNLFNRGKENQLAYYGQQYTDALPDRAAVKALKRPKRGRAKTQKT